MSYIQSTIECVECGYQMNIATGTFGSGIPDTCPKCSMPLSYKFIGIGWFAQNKDDLVP